MEVQREKVIKLLIVAAIMHTVDSEERQLDMSHNAVDDQFQGCRDEMLNKVLGKGGLIEQEQTANAFLKEWKDTPCQEPIPNGQKEHAQALAFYTETGSKEFRDAFHSALHSQGGNATAYRGFQFKALHFLLTDALQILPSKGCATVYHMSEHNFHARVGDEVRFGMFISAASQYDDEVLPERSGTVFNITSCAAVNVEKSACYPEEFELLIPPFEEFKVLNVMNIGVHRLIYLNHTQRYSNQNCLLLKGHCVELAPSGEVADCNQLNTTPPIIPRFPVTKEKLGLGSSCDSVNSSMLLLLAASLYLCCCCLGHVPL